MYELITDDGLEGSEFFKQLINWPEEKYQSFVQSVYNRAPGLKDFTETYVTRLLAQKSLSDIQAVSNDLIKFLYSAYPYSQVTRREALEVIYICISQRDNDFLSVFDATTDFGYSHDLSDFYRSEAFYKLYITIKVTSKGSLEAGMNLDV